MFSNRHDRARLVLCLGWTFSAVKIGRSEDQRKGYGLSAVPFLKKNCDRKLSAESRRSSGQIMRKITASFAHRGRRCENQLGCSINSLRRDVDPLPSRRAWFSSAVIAVGGCGHRSGLFKVRDCFVLGGGSPLRKGADRDHRRACDLFPLHDAQERLQVLLSVTAGRWCV